MSCVRMENTGGHDAQCLLENYTCLGQKTFEKATSVNLREGAIYTTEDCVKIRDPKQCIDLLADITIIVDQPGEKKIKNSYD